MPPRTGPQSIFGEPARHWRRIFVVWLVLATPVAYLIFRFVEPTYEASSLLRAEPYTIDLYDPGQRGPKRLEEGRPYLETQIRLLTSDRVLDAALAKPAISNLAMIRASKDPKASLRQEMRVEIVGRDTFLIEVALSSRDPEEAAALVNAVVEAYLDQHNAYQQATNRSLNIRLENELDKLDKQIRAKQDELEEVTLKGNDSAARPILAPTPAAKPGDGAVEPSLKAVTDEQYRNATDRLLQADFELMDAQSRLDAARRPKAQAAAEGLQERESAVEEAQRRRDRYRDYIARLEVRSVSQTNDRLRASKLNQDLAYLQRLHEAVKQKLGQLEFEIGQEAYRISLQDRASVPRTPTDNQRFRYMLTASAGIFLVVLGWFLVREVPARRVAGPGPMPG